MVEKAPDPEKQAGLTFTEPSEDHSSHHIWGHGAGPHHHRSRARERMRHFLHPDGRSIHVASSPEEAASLRTRLEQESHHEDRPFDVHISGTTEHLQALRECHSHHEGRRQSLRQRHGEIYEQFASVQSELEQLQYELERVTSHGVSLDAHFSRFGYNARIRTYDDEDAAPPHSGATTPSSERKSSSGGRGGESSAEHGYVTPLKLFKTPTVRQYFHKGILWRASGTEEVQSFELFIDLLYVGIIAINGDAASEDPTGLSLLRFVITFTLSWKIWNDMALIISWFETDDIFQRVSILFLLACLFGYTTNITHAFEHTYATLIGFYLAARMFMVCYLLLVAWLVKMVRPIMIMYAASGLVGAALWIGSIHLEWPNQLALIWIAIAVDLAGPIFFFVSRLVALTMGKDMLRRFDKVFEFYPAINIEHRTERTGAFVTLVFGYTVVAILYQSARNGIDAFFGKAILGLIQCFFYNWLYFEIDASNLVSHAIRRAKFSAFAWAMAHLPFIMAFVLGGGALARLVVAHDCPDTELEDLTEVYMLRSEEEIHIGIRWFYCAGFGVALAFMGLISISHLHKETKGLRLGKKYRLVLRFAVAIVLILLPLAEGLNSLQLIGTVTGLISFVLICELWACSSYGDKLMQRGEQCHYVGRCNKKQLRALANGEATLSSETLVSESGQEGGMSLAPMA
ncbi:hypothetical protein K431DRAFT_65128 [Polychaeton citri CBS 116435]|uniref:Low temperature requirement protein A n=1 Tax=Polychaeton citri CBS 116435 TaxID=1314669 RepID=A0A9P4QBZ8_9PEZI|nr:hypothetical protein K431DRAFT_65128 [Polychaeton citri CBS 116435]